MSVEVKMVIGCLEVKGNSPPGQGAKVARCDKCKKMVWISQSQIKKKQSESGLPIWCSECCKELAKEDDVDVKIIPLQEDGTHEDINLGHGKLSSDIFKKVAEKMGEDAGFADKMREFEEKMFAKTQSAVDQHMAFTEENIPQLCKILMTRLRIFERTDDLALACMVGTFIENALCNRREKFGPGKAFEGYELEDIAVITCFLMGIGSATSKAVKNMKDIVKSPVVPKKEWEEGWEAWWQGLFGDLEEKENLGESDL